MLQALRQMADRPSSFGEDVTSRLRRHMVREEPDRHLRPRQSTPALMSRQRNAEAHTSQFEHDVSESAWRTVLALLGKLTGTGTRAETDT